MGTLYFNANDINEQCPCYVIDNDILRHAMFTRLQHHVNINSHNLNIVSGSVNSLDFANQDNSANENIDTSITDPPLSTIDIHPQTADCSDIMKYYG